MNVHMSSLYESLDRGDGTCKYYEDTSRLCSIYEKRPQICNVEEMFEQHFKKLMVKEEYYRQNYKACDCLKRK